MERTSPDSARGPSEEEETKFVEIAVDNNGIETIDTPQQITMERTSPDSARGPPEEEEAKFVEIAVDNNGIETIDTPQQDSAVRGGCLRQISAPLSFIKMFKGKKEFRFIFLAVAIFASYFIFGMLQEKITRGKYGDNDRYTCTLSLVLIQCFVNYIFAQILTLSWKHEKDTTRNIYYFSSALTYLLGMVSSNMALQWVNYPTQVVGKAAKPIPVLLLGVLLGRKSYPLKKYVSVFVIVIGIVLFMYKDQSNKTSDTSSGFGIGEILIILSLAMDGLLGAVQERIKSESSPTAYSMMLNTNAWSTGILWVGVILSGEAPKFIHFVSLYPEVLVYIAAISVMGAFGQLFIYFMVSEFGPLPCSVVTTTRKFFTVLASVIIFGNVLIARQWVGAVLVFSGLFLDIFYNKSKSQPPKQAEQ